MPRTKLTEEQKNEFRIASNRVSLESLRYAADIADTHRCSPTQSPP